jgi:hypothetical protein
MPSRRKRLSFPVGNLVRSCEVSEPAAGERYLLLFVPDFPVLSFGLASV